MRTVARFVVALGAVVVGCGSPESTAEEPVATSTASVATPTMTAAPTASATAAPTKKATAADALVAFKRAWSESVLPGAKPKDKAFVTAIDKKMAKSDNEYRMQEMPCKFALERVQKFNQEMKQDFVLVGSLDAVLPDASCWSVYYAGGMKQEVEGIFTDPDLTLLLVWRIPEG